jgi:hypothetical protein
LSACRFRAGTKTSRSAVEAGDVRHSEAGTVERMEITRGTPRAIVFELK